jgi:hypothetical protein
MKVLRVVNYCVGADVIVILAFANQLLSSPGQYANAEQGSGEFDGS